MNDTRKELPKSEYEKRVSNFTIERIKAKAEELHDMLVSLGVDHFVTVTMTDEDGDSNILTMGAIDNSPEQLLGSALMTHPKTLIELSEKDKRRVVTFAAKLASVLPLMLASDDMPPISDIKDLLDKIRDKLNAAPE